VPDRAKLARYGVMIEEVQQAVASALGGETVTTTVEGRERYSVNVRYPRDFRSDPRAIASDVLVPTLRGGMLPLGQLAEVRLTQGPTTIRTENAQLASMSMSISATATSRATSPTPARPCRTRWSSRPAPMRCGVANSNISNGPRPS